MKLALISIVLSVAVISNSRAEPETEPQTIIDEEMPMDEATSYRFSSSRSVVRTRSSQSTGGEEYEPMTSYRYSSYKSSTTEPDPEPQLTLDEETPSVPATYRSRSSSSSSLNRGSSNVVETDPSANDRMTSYQYPMTNPSWAQTVPAYDMQVGYQLNSQRMMNGYSMPAQTAPNMYPSMPSYQPYSSSQSWNQVNPSWSQNQQILNSNSQTAATGVQEIPSWTPQTQQYNNPQYSSYSYQNQWNSLPAQNTWSTYSAQQAPATTWASNNAGASDQMSQTFVPGLPTWRKSYTPLPGKTGCYNRCRPSCSTSYQAGFGCQPSCRSSCNVRPSCGARGQVNWNGNTMVCGRPNYGPSWGNSNNMQWGATPYNNMQGPMPYSNSQQSFSQNQAVPASSNNNNNQMNPVEEIEQP